MKFKVSAVLPMPAEDYFVERDSAAFRSLVAQMCKLEALEMGNSWMEGETEVYEFVTKPDIERYVPPQFKHFLPGGDLHYTDVIEYDPKLIAASPYKMRVHSVPPIFSSKAKINSWMIIESVTPETCRQTLEGEIEIRILGLGHLAEKIIVDNLKNVYKGVPKIVERWAQFRSEVMKQPGGKDILIRGRPRNTSVDWINDRTRELLQAPESESDTASVASTPTNDSYPSGRPQSVEEMLESCSVGRSTPTDTPNGTDDEDEFFDARDNASWANLDDYLASHAATPDGALHRDARDMQCLVSAATKSGRRLRRVEVDAPKLPAVDHRGEKRVPVTSRRFSQTYNEDLAEWKDFWQEHKVPETKHTPDVEKRLGNLFGIGAALGLFKPGKKHQRHFHLRRKHRAKEGHGRTESGATGDGSAGAKSDLSLNSHITEASNEGEPSSHPPHEEDTNRHHHHHKHSDGKKEHKPSRSGAFVKELFGIKKHHDKKPSAGVGGGPTATGH